MPPIVESDTIVHRLVETKGVSIRGLYYYAVELDELVGKVIAVEDQPGTLSLLAIYEGYYIQIHADAMGELLPAPNTPLSHEAKMEAFENELLKALYPCAHILGYNGPASYLLATELATLGKPISDLTLGEIHAAQERLDAHYATIDRVLESHRAK